VVRFRQPMLRAADDSAAASLSRKNCHGPLCVVKVPLFVRDIVGKLEVLNVECDKCGLGVGIISFN
jgi:hypothetical protein